MPKATINDIINTAMLKEGGGGAANTMIVSNHLAQMVLFGIRQGVEFYPAHDPDQSRREFINDLVERNKLDLYLKAIWEAFIGTGSVLFYLRPIGNTYDILWFPKSQFEPFYKDGGRELEKVVITYPFKYRSHLNMEQEKWIRLVIKPDEISKGVYESNPGFGLQPEGFVQEEKTINTLGLVPCVVVDNNPVALGKRGTNDFDWLGGQIEEHDDLMAAINQNIRFFGNPSLVTTRNTQEVTEAAFGEVNAPRTISSGAAFTNQYVPSTYKFDYSFQGGHNGNGSKIKPVIGGVEPDERFGFIQPDAVSGDQNRWALQYEELIRTALGGVSENGINSGATAFEIKSLFGRAAATAMTKAIPLYTYGICKLFELAIAAEEYFFQESFTRAIGWDVEKKGPLRIKQIDLYIDGGENPKSKKKIKPQGVPNGVIGLRPRGNRKVLWRWTGPVFEDGPIDLQQKSIVARNLSEEGINTLEQLRFLFPDKTDEELDKMLGGVPFRRLGNTLGLVNNVLGLLGQLYQTPDPMNPKMPLVARYGRFADQMLFILFQKMLTELSRGQGNDRTIRDTDPNPFSKPSGIPTNPGDGSGPTYLQPGPAGQLPYPGYSGNAAGPGTANLPMAGPAGNQRNSVSNSGAGADSGVSPAAYAAGLLSPAQYGSIGGTANVVPANGQLQPAQQQRQLLGPGPQQGLGRFGNAGIQPEFTSPIPAPGAVLSTGPELQSGAAQQPWSPHNAPVYGESDLQRQPGLLAKLFPTFFAAARAVSSKRGKSDKR